MLSPRAGSPRRPGRHRWSLMAGVAVLGLAPLTGCQVEYAGMTLPSGKYMHDDVQYFAEGPSFPWANTQAATQRANMAAQGMVPPPPPGLVPPPDPNFVGTVRPPQMVPPTPPPPGGFAAPAIPVPVNPANPGGAKPKPVAPPPGAADPSGTDPK